MTGKICGKGCYFSNHVETAEVYAQSGLTIPETGKSYKIIFQSRLNPEAIRIPEKNNRDYWIVNSQKDIRPYGILIKKI